MSCLRERPPGGEICHFQWWVLSIFCRDYSKHRVGDLRYIITLLLLSSQTRWTPCILYQKNCLIAMMMHMSTKEFSAILDFWENGKKPPFSAVSQHPDHIESRLFWWKLMVSLHIGHTILFSHLLLHYFRYKMAAEICEYIWGSSLAHRPCIIHQNDHLIPMMMYM